MMVFTRLFVMRGSNLPGHNLGERARLKASRDHICSRGVFSPQAGLKKSGQTFFARQRLATVCSVF